MSDIIVALWDMIRMEIQLTLTNSSYSWLCVISRFGNAKHNTMSRVSVDNTPPPLLPHAWHDKGGQVFHRLFARVVPLRWTKSMLSDVGYLCHI